MNWTRLPDGRSYLPKGTILKFEYQGGYYKILGDPVGYGGAGILYPAVHVEKKNEHWIEDGMWAALKECYPCSTDGMLTRSEYGEIHCVEERDLYSEEYYASAKAMMRREKEITGQIFHKGFRLTPLWDIAEQELISLDGEIFHEAKNQYGIMERLDEKGTSLARILKEQPGGYLTAYQSVCILGQILQALEEVHSAGYLHGDIQENNIFLKGADAAQDQEGLVTLIDFGSARALLEDGATARIADKKLYSTSGYSAPECAAGNDGTLRLTKAADIYSVGYLMLRMLVGKNMDTKALQLVVNGKYLYARQAKKIGCPAASMDMINKILDKALREHPGERYQTAEEMLQDIQRLKRALAPKKSAIASVDYEAFISYCHEEKSIQAAEQIQKMIERYKIPKSVQKLSGKTKMGKVFRDKEELASSNDMEVHLQEALNHSEYLIVLLSPKVPESPWVNREIELFLQTHDRDHVLTILVDGELNESFPEYLRKSEKYDNGQMKMVSVESLAADIRGIDKKEQKQKLKTEIYRLLAPILGCSYDDLRQRQKEYKTKMLVRSMSAALIIAGTLAGYMTWQAAQIQKNYWETLIKQSRYLADVSSELLTSGDRIKALQVAMEALPESEADKSKPWTAEAEAALANALYAYQGVDAASHSVQSDYLVEMENNLGDCYELSEDGSWLLSMDTDLTIYIWDTRNGSLKRRWDHTFWQQQGADPSIIYGTFLDDGIVFLLTETSMIQIDVETEMLRVHKKLSETFSEDDFWAQLEGVAEEEKEERVWHLSNQIIRLADCDQYSLCAMDPEKKTLAVYDTIDGYLKVYDVEKTSLRYYRQLSDLLKEHLASPQENDLAISSDGRYAALASGEYWGLLEEGYEAGLLLMVDMQEDFVYTASSGECGYYKCCFDQNNRLAAFSYAPYTLLFDSVNIECPGKMECYDLEKEEKLWEFDLNCQMGNDKNYGIIVDETADRFILWHDQQVRAVEADTGEIFRTPRCEEDIIDVYCRRENNYLVTTEDAGMYLWGGDRTFVKLGTNVTRDSEVCLFDNKNFSAYLLADDGSIAAMHTLLDPGAVNVKLDQNVYGITTYRAENAFYSVSAYGNEEQTITTETFYHSDTDEKWFDLKMDGMLDQSMVLKDGKTYCYVEHVQKTDEDGYSDSVTCMIAYDMEKQEELWRVESEVLWSHIKLVQTEAQEELAMWDDNGQIRFLDLQTGEWLEEETITAETDLDYMSYTTEAYMTNSGAYVIKPVKNRESDTYELSVYNREKDCWMELSEEIQKLEVFYGTSIALAQEKHLMAVYEKNKKQISVVDLDKNCVWRRIPIGGKDHIKMQFLNNDTRLLFDYGSYGGYMKLWDLEQDCMVMEDNQKFESSDIICVDETEHLMLVRGINEENADLYMNGMWMTWIYILEENRFYPYVRVFNGVYDEKTKRIGGIGGEKNTLYWFEQYTLDELLEWGREVEGDAKLSEADKIKYFMED